MNLYTKDCFSQGVNLETSVLSIETHSDTSAHTQRLQQLHINSEKSAKQAEDISDAAANFPDLHIATSKDLMDSILVNCKSNSKMLYVAPDALLNEMFVNFNKEFNYFVFQEGT